LKYLVAEKIHVLAFIRNASAGESPFWFCAALQANFDGYKSQLQISAHRLHLTLS
jgi:hypothetical protein